MEECHKMLTDQVDWTNPEGDQVRVDVNRPLPLGGPLDHVTIQTQFFFNKDLEYLRYGSKGSSLVLSISKIKAASYPDFGLELLVPKQMWIDDTDMILRHVKKKSVHTCGFSVSSELKPTQDTVSQSGSPLPTSTATTSVITITTSFPPPPPQSTRNPTLVKRISELEQHMADLLQYNLALEERLDKHRSQLYKLENLNIPHHKLARIKKRRDLPRTPSGSPSSQPSHLPPLAGASSAPVGISRTQELSPTDSLIQDDSIPDEHVLLFDDEDSMNDHLLKVDSRKDWWKPLPKEERPATPEPASTILYSNVSDVEKN
nr:hypothetical protein [Tanacetum cinerariifolium]